MGREWLWSGSSSSSTSSLANGDCKESSNAAPPGCMSGVLHCLHFHHLLFNGGSRSPPASSSSLSSLSSPLPPRADLAHREQLRGFEAPRNSLELNEGIKAMSSSTAASAMEDEFYDVPVAIEISSAEGEGSSQQQVETPRSTPGIVARLMGLEISPDHVPTQKMTAPPQPQVLRSKKVKSKKSFDGDLQCCAMREHDSPSPRQPLRSLDRNAAAASSLGFGITSDGAGSRSLPETPRVSLSSARYCDEYPRLSLQLNKENYMTGEYCSLPPSSSPYSAVKSKKRDLGRHQDENKSHRSRHYACEIVELVKETITSRTGDGGRPDDIKSKSKRIRKTTEKKKLSMVPDPPSPRSPPQLMALSNKADEVTKKLLKTTKMVLNKCKKADNERFTERIRRQEKQAPTTLASLFRSADVLSADKNLKPDKNQIQPVPRTYSMNSPTRGSTLALGAAVQQSSNQKKGQGQDRLWKSDGPEFRYIKSIVERAVVPRVRSSRWSSPFLPVDPIIFDELELELPLFIGDLRFRWNRKLRFHLVEEILGDLLLGYSELLPSSTTTHLATDKRSTVSRINAEALLRRVWGQIQSFPAEGNDLYALISRDLPEANVRRLLRHPSVVEEAEDVVFEVEGEILDGLVGETAASLALSSSSSSPSFPGGGGGGVDPRRNLSQHCRCVWTSALM